MPLKTVSNGDLMRSIIVGVVTLLGFIKVVPEEMQAVLIETLESIGVYITGLIIAIGTLVSLFRKVKPDDTSGAK